LASLFLFSWTVQRIFRDQEITLSALTLLITSEIFILHARQCRYYALTIFAQIWILSAFYQALDPKHKRIFISLALALTMQFYANYINALGNIIALVLISAILKKKYPSLWRSAIRSFFLTVALASPWLYFAKMASQTRLAGQENLLEKWGYYLCEIHFHLVPWVVFIIPVVVHLMVGRKPLPHSASEAGGQKGKAVLLFIGVLFPVHLFVASLAPGIYWRYILPLVPATFVLTAYIVRTYFRPCLLRYVAVLCLALSNIFSVVTLYPLRGVHHPNFPVVRISRGLLSNYHDRLEDIVAFFQERGNAYQSLYVFDPEFPLIFYTKLKIIDGRMASGKVTEPLPDWILAESASGVLSLPPIDLPEGLKSYYQPIAVEVHNSRRGGSIPEPDSYEYFTNPQKVKLIVFKRDREVRQDQR
jgi:hypothetical protein